MLYHTTSRAGEMTTWDDVDAGFPRKFDGIDGWKLKLQSGPPLWVDDSTEMYSTGHTLDVSIIISGWCGS